ncbi:hypothetical protein AAMO2058_000623700 [Amorphochlora amoebiformis]
MCKCSNCGSAISWTIDIQNTTKASFPLSNCLLHYLSSHTSKPTNYSPFNVVTLPIDFSNPPRSFYSANSPSSPALQPSILETGDSSDEASERKLKSKAETATESGTTEASSRQSPSASEKKEKTSGWGKGGREGRTGLEGEIQGSVDSSRKASEVDWEMHKEGLEQFRKESKVFVV